MNIVGISSKLIAALSADDLLNRVLDRWIYRRQTPHHTGDLQHLRPFQILGYHKVSPEPHPFFQPLPPILFERQMQTLKHHYQVFHLDDLVEMARQGEVPERAVAVTFDDGYQDNFQHAFPILKKLQLPATIFLAAGAIDNKLVLWHDRVFDSFRFATVKRCRLKDWLNADLILESPQQARGSLAETLQLAKQLPAEKRLGLVDAIEEALQPALPANGRTRMLSWKEIQVMQATELVRFGSHTFSHPILTRVSQHQLNCEIFESKAILEDRLGKPVTTFAYPNGKAGDFSETVKNCLEAAGYRSAVTTCPGFNTSKQDLFELKREQPWHFDSESFRLYLFHRRHCGTAAD